PIRSRVAEALRQRTRSRMASPEPKVASVRRRGYSLLRPMYRIDILDRVIEMAVLGLLQDHELHGYELRKRLTGLVGLRGAISFGSLYPALARLEAVGAVKAVDAGAARPIPMTGSLSGEASAFLARRRSSVGRGGRARKVYGITDHGRELLVTLLRDPH